jgi:hypothetical protein
MYTIFPAVQRQQRKTDVMMYFGLTACSAVYYHAGSSLLGAFFSLVFLFALESSFHNCLQCFKFCLNSAA